MKYFLVRRIALFVLLCGFAGAQGVVAPKKLGPHFAPWAGRAQQGEPMAMYELAREILDSGCDGFGGYAYRLQANAFPLLEKLAKEGNPRAMYYLADLLDYRKDYVAARDWALKAAEGGEIRAYWTLSALYSQSQSPFRDRQKAKEYGDTYQKVFAERVRAGDEETMRGIANQWGGWGSLARFEVGRAVLACAQKGDRGSQYEVGMSLMELLPARAIEYGYLPEGTDPQTLTTQMIRSIATEWLEKAAEQNYYKAAIELANHTNLMRTTTPGTTVENWLEEAERMLGTRNRDLIQIYEGGPDDEVESTDPEGTQKAEEPVSSSAAKAAPPTTGTKALSVKTSTTPAKGSPKSASKSIPKKK